MNAEVIKALLKKYLSSVIITIAIGGGVVATLSFQDGEPDLNITVDAPQP